MFSFKLLFTLATVTSIVSLSLGAATAFFCFSAKFAVALMLFVGWELVSRISDILWEAALTAQRNELGLTPTSQLVKR
jgi:uncharacterized membrane protein